jgi:hypothetical protein
MDIVKERQQVFSLQNISNPWRAKKAQSHVKSFVFVNQSFMIQPSKEHMLLQ